MEPQDVERRLTTIIAADIVGYSRLMGLDEADTLAALRRHRSDLIDPKAAQYGGRIVKLIGDGTLMEFASVVDAVAFAVEVQCAMKERNVGVPDDRQIVYRIGINVGDILVEGEDIYGDGVNVAARLEAWPSQAGSAFAANCATRCATSWISTSRTWARSRSRILRGRYVCSAWFSTTNTSKKKKTPPERDPMAHVGKPLIGAPWIKSSREG